MGLPAHAIGPRTDLPIPVGHASAVAVNAVLASLVVVAFVWRRPLLAGAAAGRPLPAPLRGLFDWRPLRTALQSVALVLSVAVVYVGLAGRPQAVLNPAPYALYVLFWVGLVPLSLVFGPVWKVVNPLRLVHRLLERATGTTGGTRPISPRLGWWPTAALLAGFVWIELVAPNRTDPRLVAVLLVVYAVLTLSAAQVYGDAWFDRGDAFEAWSSLLGRLSVLGRRADGVLVLRLPLQGLTALGAEPGLAAVALVLIGSTAFDGLTRSRWWVEHLVTRQLAVATLGLVASIAVVTALYVVATSLATSTRGLSGQYAASLVPIAAGYAVAHHFSVLVFEGQTALVLASDPLARGDDLLGLTGARTDLRLIGGSAISVVQVVAVTVGHVLAVLLAHERSVTLLPAAAARRAQVPLSILMLGFTAGAVALLLAT